MALKSIMEQVLKVVMFTTKIMIIFGCIGCLIIQGRQCVERYIQMESKMIVTQKSSQDATFVAFTICPNFNKAYKVDVLNKYGLTTDDYRDGKSMDIDLFNEVTHGLTDILDLMIITTINQKFTINSSTHYGVEITSKPFRIFGKCFTIQVNKEIIKLGISRVEFLTKMNSFIYMHHPGQFMSIDDRTKVFTTANQNHFIDMSYSVVENTLESESKVPCSPETNFNFDDCLYRKLHDSMLYKFNCTVPFMPKMNGSKTCKDPKKFKEILRYFERNSSHGQRKLCPMPCSTLNIALGLLYPNDRPEQDGKSYTKFYLKSFTSIQKVVYDYTLLSMLAEIGGYTGLLLGASVADLTLIVEHLRKYFF